MTAVLAGRPVRRRDGLLLRRVEVDEDRPSARDPRGSTTCATPTSTSTIRPTSSSTTPSCSATSSTRWPPTAAPIDAVHLGGGGFTIPRYVEATRPGSDSLVLELDPGVVRLAEDELGLETSDRLRVRTGDARGHLRDVADDSADLVVGDAFGGRAVPYHLATREFADGRRPRAARRRRLRPEHHRPAAAAASCGPTWRRCARCSTHVAVLGPPGRFDGTERWQHVVVASDAPLPARRAAAELAAERGADEVLARRRRARRPRRRRPGAHRRLRAGRPAARELITRRRGRPSACGRRSPAAARAAGDRARDPAPPRRRGRRSG